MHAQSEQASGLSPSNDALYDKLTGLPSEALYTDRLKHALERAERPGSPGFSVVMLDLDDFEAIRERLGDAASDTLLQRLGSCLSDCLRPGDTVARFDGGKFAILLENVTATSALAQVAHRLSDTLKHSSGEHALTASLGIVPSSAQSGSATAKTMLRDADTALQRVKEQGKGRYTLF